MDSFSSSPYVIILSTKLITVVCFEADMHTGVWATEWFWQPEGEF
jgi:hypothetical protein